MIALELILEGLGLGFLLYLICVIGIRNGAIGMVHLYDQKVQERVIELGLTTAEAIRKRSVLFRSLDHPGYGRLKALYHGNRQKEKMDHGGRRDGASCRHSLWDHGTDPEMRKERKNSHDQKRTD